MELGYYDENGEWVEYPDTRVSRHYEGWKAKQERQSMGIKPSNAPRLQSVRKKHVSHYEGFVLKKRAWVGTWAARYFILNHHLLLYGADRENAISECDLRTCTVELSADKSHIVINHHDAKGKKTMFKAKKGEDDEYMTMEDLNERWLYAVQEQIDNAHGKGKKGAKKKS